MSREIKFRAWNESNSIMVTGIIPFADREITYKPQVGTFQYMQYTGLKDKNETGVEVYEGDVVQRRDGKRGQIVWQHEMCGFGIAFSEEEPLGSLSSWFEVVGNIYENPDLLDK